MFATNPYVAPLTPCVCVCVCVCVCLSLSLSLSLSVSSQQTLLNFHYKINHNFHVIANVFITSVMGEPLQHPYYSFYNLKT